MNIRLFLFLLLGAQITYAQFPGINWDYDTGAPAFGSAAAADMDNDGFHEIVFTTYTNDGRAHCLNAEDGSIKWIYDIGGCGDVAPVIYDVNQDDTLDVIINGSCNPTMFCLNGVTGKLIWDKPSGGGDSPPTIADVDRDGRPEILFGNFSGQVRIFNGEDGSTAKSIQVNPNNNAIQTAPTLIDVNNDSWLDIIVANYFNDDGLYVWAIDYNTGAKIWTHYEDDTTSSFHAYHGGAVADIDQDSLLEYVIGSNNGSVWALNVEDGSELWKIPVPASNMSAISIADLDEDGELEVIFNNNDPVTFDERIRIHSGKDGTEEWTFPITFTSFRGAAISDINGNGKLDIVTGHFMGRVRAVEPYVGLIWEENLINQFPAGLPWFQVDHGPLIADFDQNGTTDVFVVAGYGTYTPDSLNTGRAFMIEAGTGACPEWLMFRHDVLRTGYLSPEEVDAACNPSTSLESINNLDISMVLFPNPTNGAATLSFELPSPAHVEGAVYNSLGGTVTDLGQGHLPAGTHEIKWNSQGDIPEGIYFFRLSMNGIARTQKVVVAGQP